MLTKRIAVVILALTAAGATWCCQSQINRPHATTVQGCIADDGGQYVLTGDLGTKYVLTGSNKDAARAQVGHEAIVRGELVYDKLTTGAPAETNSHPENQLQVATVQFVSGNCSAGH